MSAVTPGNAPIIRTKKLVAIDVDNKPGQIIEATPEVEAKIEQMKAAPKKPFVRKPFLTDRPFGNHVPLRELRDQLRAEQYRK